MGSRAPTRPTTYTDKISIAMARRRDDNALDPSRAPLAYGNGTENVYTQTKEKVELAIAGNPEDTHHDGSLAAKKAVKRRTLCATLLWRIALKHMLPNMLR